MAALRVGEKFAGSTNAHLPVHFARFDIILGGVTTNAEGRLWVPARVAYEYLLDALVIRPVEAKDDR